MSIGAFAPITCDTANNRQPGTDGCLQHAQVRTDAHGVVCIIGSGLIQIDCLLLLFQRNINRL
jgi:hypothetical protein